MCSAKIFTSFSKIPSGAIPSLTSYAIGHGRGEELFPDLITEERDKRREINDGVCSVGFSDTVSPASRLTSHPREKTKSFSKGRDYRWRLR